MSVWIPKSGSIVSPSSGLLTAIGGKAPNVYTSFGIGGAGAPILPFAAGTFTRSSDGSFLTSAETVQFVGPNILRYENRSDGFGAVPLFEGARTNLLLRSQEINLTPWVLSLATISADTEIAPDGTPSADVLQMTASGASFVRQDPTLADDTIYTVSGWMKLISGNGDWRLNIQRKSGANSVTPFTATAIWQPFTVSFDSSNGTGTPRVHLQNAGTALAGNIAFWGLQCESSMFPTSYIQTTAATATRSPDILTFTNTQVPAQLKTGIWRFDCYPYWSQDQIPVDRGFCFSMQDAQAHFVDFERSGGNTTARVFTQDTLRVVSNPLTFSRHQQLTITINSVTGSISVAGATTGNGTVVGTPFVFPNLDLGVGHRISGGPLDAFFGRISEPRGV